MENDAADTVRGVTNSNRAVTSPIPNEWDRQEITKKHVLSYDFSNEVSIRTTALLSPTAAWIGLAIMVERLAHHLP